MDYLEKFNSTFTEFIDDIIRIFPDDSELRMYKTAIRAAVCINDKLALNIFTESVVSTYGSKILARDESFFLEHDYSDITENVEYNALINKIKRYWTTMNEDNRNAVWKYFKVLILLSNKINK
jgi:hypothetical protein